MDITNDLAAATVLHDQLRTANRVLVDGAYKTYGQIDDFVTTRARGYSTWDTSDRVELESKA
jgi:hypothetical protein